MRFLDNAGQDWDIACAIVRKAQQMKATDRQAELKAIVEAITKGVGAEVGRQISRMF